MKLVSTYLQEYLQTLQVLQSLQYLQDTDVRDNEGPILYYLVLPSTT